MLDPKKILSGTVKLLVTLLVAAVLLGCSKDSSNGDGSGTSNSALPTQITVK